MCPAQQELSDDKHWVSGLRNEMGWNPTMNIWSRGSAI
jgi:hypothetical protein